MATVTDVNTRPASGLLHIDAVLDTGPGWNWLTPARNELFFTFSLVGTESVSSQYISGATSVFSAAQQVAVVDAMAHLTDITGIRFTLTTDGNAADFHFANGDISIGNFTGYTRWNWNYRSDGAQQVTSYTADAYVFIDAITQPHNLTPTVGNGGVELLLHEIGHAMGLKHPFAGDPRLATGDDHTGNTLMSYTHQGGNQDDYSPFDVAALSYLYGGDGLGGALGQGGTGRFLIGHNIAETLVGTAARDVLQGNGGNDVLQGGDGIDTAIYTRARAEHTLTLSTGRIVGGGAGNDTLQQVERLQFADTSVAIDLAGAAGSTAQILRAIFGSAALHNPVYAGIGLSLFDGGMAYADIVALAIATPEFAQLAGGRSNTAFVDTVYRNVVGVAPTAEQRAGFVALLDDGTHTQASLGVLAAQIDVNVQSAELVGLATTGLAFTPAG